MNECFTILFIVFDNNKITQKYSKCALNAEYLNIICQMFLPLDTNGILKETIENTQNPSILSQVHSFSFDDHVEFSVFKDSETIYGTPFSGHILICALKTSREDIFE